MVLTSASRSLPILGIVAALAATAATSSPPAEDLRSGEEGSKAALVRIELSAVAEIAHIDHSTGEVQIARGRSTVPLGTGTGVLTSADGVVATTWDNLDVDQDAVAVYAANELFTKVIGVPVVGNDGDPARRGTTPDAHWGPHLQHCYQQVTHCILFVAPQYRVLTYTAEPGGSRAELLNAPSAPTDVALLRITGGGGAPTARLAATEADPASDHVLVGFAGPPGKEQPPRVLPVTADGATKQITAKEDLAGPLREGLSGGPVLDRASGDVVGSGRRGPVGRCRDPRAGGGRRRRDGAGRRGHLPLPVRRRLPQGRRPSRPGQCRRCRQRAPGVPHLLRLRAGREPPRHGAGPGRRARLRRRAVGRVGRSLPSRCSLPSPSPPWRWR